MVVAPVLFLYWRDNLVAGREAEQEGGWEGTNPETMSALRAPFC